MIAVYAIFKRLTDQSLKMKAPNFKEFYDSDATMPNSIDWLQIKKWQNIFSVINCEKNIWLWNISRHVQQFFAWNN